MLKKWTALTLISVMVFVVSACGGTKSGTETTSPSTAASTDAPKETEKPTDKPVEKTVIKMLGWKQANANAVIESINKKFEEKYPQYKVEYTTTEPNDVYKQAMQAKITANDIDIFPNLSSLILSPKDWTPGAQKPPWQQWIENGLIADLSGQPFIKNYLPSAITDGGTFNDKVYAIPTGTVAFSGLFYNKDIFEKYSLKVPTTWDEFIKVLDTLKENKVTPIAMAGKDGWPIKILEMGLQSTVLDDQMKFIEGLWKGTAKFNDPQPIEALDKIKLIMDKYTIDKFMAIGYQDLPPYFTKGQVAMIADGTWDAPTIDGLKPNFKYGYFPIPGNKDAAKNNFLTGKYDLTWLVAEKGGNKEGAIKWLEFFSEKENYTEFVKAAGFLPTQPDVKTSAFNDELAPYLENFKLGYEIQMISRKNVGEHIAAEGNHPEFLAPGGPFKTAKDLADVQQKEWDAAK